MCKLIIIMENWRSFGTVRDESFRQVNSKKLFICLESRLGEFCWLGEDWIFKCHEFEQGRLSSEWQKNTLCFR